MTGKASYSGFFAGKTYMKKAYLVLENGRIFEGTAFGAEKEASGELVFTTGMVGYVETLTDPSHCGQIIVSTFPQIGNYGVCLEDIESEKIHAAAYVVREHCTEPSNFRSQMAINDFLVENGIPGIFGIDTRELTRLLRDCGSMNAKIAYERPSEAVFESLKELPKKNAADVSCREKREYTAENAKYTVAAIDLGIKNSLISSFLSRGCNVKVFPFDAKAEELLFADIDGIVLSDGPGNPNDNTAAAARIKELFGKIPMLGVGMGFQLLTLAAGGSVYKLQTGHRGGQPVRDVFSDRILITSQNHGYAVAEEGLPPFAKISHKNVNDGSCEGIVFEGKKCFGVQFQPEGCAGPMKKDYLFEEFFMLLQENKKCR